MTEKILAIEYLVEKLDGGLECHCDVFRYVGNGMKPATAERRLREWRELYSLQVFKGPALFKPGYTVIGHIWKFTRPFIAWLKQQVKAAYRLEAKRGSR